MYKVYVLPKPSFVEWLFGIAPEIVATALDGEAGSHSTIKLKHKGKEFGRIEVEFEKDKDEKGIVNA